MEHLSFGPDDAFMPRGEEEKLQRVTLAPLTMPMSLGSPWQAAVFRIAPGGRIVGNPGPCPQLLAVLDGAGEVSGQAGACTAVAGVFLEEHEEHEVRSEPGLTILILQGEGLRPFRRPA